MPVACLCGIGPDVLTSLGGHVPAIEPAQVRQIGIRSVDQADKPLVKQHGLDLSDMLYIDEVGMKQLMEEAIAGLDARSEGLRVEKECGITCRSSVSPYHQQTNNTT